MNVMSIALNPIFLSALALALIAAAPGGVDRHFDAGSVAYFEKNVRPLLVNNCNTCHSATTNSKGGLHVDDRNGLLQGGNQGPAVVPGDPDHSILIQAVLQTEDDLKMPPKKRLSPEEIAVLTKWIKDGTALRRRWTPRRRRQSQPKIRQAQEAALGLAATESGQASGS